jgi:hypothetical protein
MTILDAEYQYDRHKLTFYFEADRRIDFRDLVSELFSLYKTRIWMQQVDTSSLSPHDAGTELAKATGFLPDKEDPASIRSSFATTNDDLLSGGSIGSDVVENEVSSAYHAVDIFNNFRTSKSNNSVEECHEKRETSFSMNYSDPWFVRPTHEE